MKNTIVIGKTNEGNRLNWVKDRLSEIPHGSKILDVGAGEMGNRGFCGHLEYISQDLCEYEGTGDGVALQTGKWCTKGIDIVSDITSIPVGSNTFDCVLCTEVLEHVPDPVSALNELARIVKPGGRLIVTVPFSSLTHFAPQHYSTGLSRYWFETHLNRLGFTISRIDSNGGWFDFVAQELWRTSWVCKRYSSMVLGLVTMIFIIPVLAMLWLIKCFDKGSFELTTFGWQVVAIKR